MDLLNFTAHFITPFTEFKEFMACAGNVSKLWTIVGVVAWNFNIYRRFKPVAVIDYTVDIFII